MNENIANKPLAERVRPGSLDGFFGQDEILGPGKMLRQAIEGGHVPSMILWGPPGTGKTTLAKIIARNGQAEFLELSAVTAGVKELKAVISEAKANEIEGKRTILFIDEIHRWNRKQQDALLPFVEQGLVTLIGATTENPSFEVIGALMSRVRLFVLKRLNTDEIKKILINALYNSDKGFKGKDIQIKESELDMIAGLADGDARKALNTLEYAANIDPTISKESVKEAFQKSHLLYDKAGEEHYNLISALIKSMRGSDPDASLYYLARMLEAGEEPLYIARRVVRFASEDIGLKNSRALEQAVAAFQACHLIGMPECNVILAQAVVYMAKCEKSNSLYLAYKKVQKDIEETGSLELPFYLRNAPTKLMKDLGYGQGYQYPPDHDYKEKQEYLPEKLRGRKYV